MKLPQGQLLRRRVVTDLGTVFTTALDEEMTGYARLEPQDALLLDTDGVGVITLENGVPTLAYHTGSDGGGPDALAAVAVAGPYRIELYELEPGVLPDADEAADLAIPPAMPAERLTGSRDLVARTREAAPADRATSPEEAESLDAVTEFLDDEAAVASVRERARKEAAVRADEWGFPTETGE